MEAKLLAALSLLLVAGQFTGEQNPKQLTKHSFYYTGALDVRKWCIVNCLLQQRKLLANKQCTAWPVTYVYLFHANWELHVYNLDIA